MRHSQPVPRACNARRVELKQDWQGGTLDPGWDTTRKRHVPEQTVPRCLPTLEPALYIARGLAAAVAGQARRQQYRCQCPASVWDATLDLKPFAFTNEDMQPYPK